ncbi:GntR family transcriptional regulator [Bradyrhizobium sp. LTSPM299]|uniref:histidine utilization repressor n=1 Tax=unclassified Bradyrhizobium TaxID=2631580 RepID=UPI0005C82390|nr:MULTISPECIES: histidine utilization repressor [unclassified Bradyrhizobium]KJC51297.1 GntR family transcriptional regulator [Bradyrhizobium sp. LTSP885]KJC56099.1 GntR family transcriptional regulator [Bradyrhizobium sp. LTSPM299]
MSLTADRGKVEAADRPTLYKQIRHDIETSILTGEWPPGHRIPFEHQLMARYGCSRMTVSKALSELAQADLIERRRRAGSFVRRPQHLSAVLKISDMRAEITALGRSYGYQLFRCVRRAATSADCARLGVRKTGKVVAIACRHSADNVPFAIEDRLIDLDSVPEATTADFAVEPPGSWLLHHVPWTEAEHTISAVVADERTAAALGVAIGAPCLVIDRYTWRSARTLTAVRLHYPGDTHRLVARFKGG